MSASEKLKALDRAMLDAPWRYDDPPLHDLGALRNALPQIVAVVKTAEGLLVYDSDKAEQKLESALAALDEALS